MSRWLSGSCVECSAGRKRCPAGIRELPQVSKCGRPGARIGDLVQSPDAVAVTPFGRFQGWDQIRDEVYVKFLQQSLTERDLQPSNVSIHTMGDSAWLGSTGRSRERWRPVSQSSRRAGRATFINGPTEAGRSCTCTIRFRRPRRPCHQHHREAEMRHAISGAVVLCWLARCRSPPSGASFRIRVSRVTRRARFEWTRPRHERRTVSPTSRAIG